MTDRWSPGIDEDGYPSVEALEQLDPYLLGALDIPGIKDRMFWVLTQFIRDCGYASGGPDVVDVRGEDMVVFAFHTGGWSGCEDFIQALRECRIAWMTTFERYDAGGHWYFNVGDRE